VIKRARLEKTAVPSGEEFVKVLKMEAYNSHEDLMNAAFGSVNPMAVCTKDDCVCSSDGVKVGSKHPKAAFANCKCDFRGVADGGASSTNEQCK